MKVQAESASQVWSLSGCAVPQCETHNIPNEAYWLLQLTVARSSILSQLVACIAAALKAWHKVSALLGTSTITLCTLIDVCVSVNNQTHSLAHKHMHTHKHTHMDALWYLDVHAQTQSKLSPLPTHRTPASSVWSHKCRPGLVKVGQFSKLSSVPTQRSWLRKIGPLPWPNWARRKLVTPEKDEQGDA